jgi:hypothetical protein
MTQGAMRPSDVRPAMKVCVPQPPKGASIRSRCPRRARPRSRVRFVFTEVSSMKTSRSGCRRMKERRRSSQSRRASFTRTRCCSDATSGFSIADTEPLEQRCDRRVVNLHALGHDQRIAQLVERDITVLGDQIFEKGLMRCKLPPSARPTLLRRRSRAVLTDCSGPSCSLCRRELQARRRSATTQTLFETSLEPRTQRIR